MIVRGSSADSSVDADPEFGNAVLANLSPKPPWTPPFPLEIFEVVTTAHPYTGPRLLRACHRAHLVGLGFKAVFGVADESPSAGSSPWPVHRDSLKLCGKPNYRLSARRRR
jgi:hypothetical protein